MINKRIKISLIRITLLFGYTLVFFPSPGLGQTNVAAKLTRPVERSVTIRQENQKRENQWEAERSDLLLVYEQLQQEYETLESENKALTAAEQSQKAQNLRLEQQHLASLEIEKQLLPFVRSVHARLSTFVDQDVPFLEKERSLRMASLETMILDPKIPVSEKYRRVMEALFVEAEYGATMEVYQDKVTIGTEVALGNVFRLGRISLFFLSLDQLSCARFNLATGRWQPLSEEYLPAIQSAVEIASKRKPTELLSLPLGRLALEGGNQ